MTNATQPTAAAPQADKVAGMRNDIAGKWPKFDATEIANLKDKDDLVARLQSKYGLDKAQAQKDVDAFANGRQL
ncbi:hypothetical protein [Hyphomicrobium sp.]|uniref:PqqD family protein n=1 Tax=Hyphomicrobium sp. TaxID=82 RepID=UPI002E35A033|nr:hypothetical protein [Hyphomicrobium sp.]HEX2839652.1 hypothetical protein [Hyphomicrobium sp.]